MITLPEGNVLSVVEPLPRTISKFNYFSIHDGRGKNIAIAVICRTLIQAISKFLFHYFFQSGEFFVCLLACLVVIRCL